MRPQTHLREVEALAGTGDASASVRALLELGLRNKLARQTDDWDPTVLHVSDCGKCPRAVFLRLTGVPESESMTLDRWMTLNLGTKAEDLYVSLLQSAGVKIKRQKEVVLEVDGEEIHGHLDLVLEIPESVREIVPGWEPMELVELKLTNSRAMAMRLKEGTPQDGHLHQVGPYMKATDLPSRIVYAASGATKGEPMLHAWRIPYSEELVMVDLKQVAQVGKMAREGQDPGIPEGYKKTSYPCSYCSWQAHCWSPRSQNGNQ